MQFKNPQVNNKTNYRWLKDHQVEFFDLIFADTWPWKYFDLDETLGLLKIGGSYVIDDMTPQSS